MPCGRNGDRVTGGWWSLTTGQSPGPEEILLEFMNWIGKYEDWDDIDLMVGGLSGALPDAFGP